MASVTDLIMARTAVRNAVFKAIMYDRWEDVEAGWNVVDAAATNLAKARIAYDETVREYREKKNLPNV